MKKKIWMKWTLMAGLVLAGLVLSLGIILPRLLDVRQYQPQIEALISKKLNRSFTVGGGMDVSFFPWVGLRLSQVNLENPKGFFPRQMVTAAGFEIRLKLLPLIQRRFQVKTFVLEDFVLYLGTDGAGRCNWEDLGRPRHSPPAPRGTVINDLTVEKFQLRNGTLVYGNARHHWEERITQLNLELKNIRLEAPIKVDLMGRIQGRGISLRGYAGPLGHLGEEGEIPLDLTLEALGNLKIRFIGRVFDFGRGLWGDVSLLPSSPRKWLGPLGRTLPGDTLNHLAGAFALSLRPGFIGLSHGHLALDLSRFDFAMGFHTRDGGDLRFDLDLDRMDLDRYLPLVKGLFSSRPPSRGVNSGSPKPRGGEGKGSWEHPMLKGRFRAGALSLGGGQLEDVVAHVRGRGGRFIVQPLTLSAYQGRLDADLTIHMGTQEPHLDLGLNISDVRLGPWVRAVTGQPLVEGRCRGRMDLSTRGRGPDQWKRHLFGEGEGRLFDGAVAGLDRLDPSLESGTMGIDWAAPMVFSILKIPFGIQGGVVTIDQAHLVSSLVGLMAHGTLDLVQGDWDFHLTPTLEWDGDVKGFNRLFKGLSQ